MKISPSCLLAASLLASTATAAKINKPSDAAPITPRKAFPDPDWEELDKRGLIDDAVQNIIHKIETAVTCAGCEALTTVLKGVAYLGDTIFVKVVTAVCSGLKVEDSDVCAGIVSEEGPIIAKVLRSITIGGRTNQVLCGSLFGLCDAPPVLPYPGTIPPPAGNKKIVSKPTSNSKPLKFVHISDTHVDLLYKNGTNTQCTKPICCRPWTPGDDVGKTQNPAGPFGSAHCDTPVTLEQSMYQAILQHAADADFMIFTGDLVDAALWLQSQQHTVDAINDMYGRITNSGFAAKVYGVIGNHDTAPVNLFPLVEPQSGYPSAVPFYNQVATDLKKWIGNDAAQSIMHNYGCYAVVHPGTNLKVISISTNFWYNVNVWIYDNNGMDTARDPGNIFKWLTGELQAAEDAGQSAFIIGHMPPGIVDAIPDYSNYFNQIITRYSSTVKGMFWGHTHTAEFEVTYSDVKNRNYGNAVIASYITSCVTPRNSNPVFRVYSIDPSTYQVLDYDDYYTSVAEIPYGSTNQPEWKKLYNAREAFGSIVSPPLPPSAPLSAAFWHNVTVAFENNDGAFQAWFDRKIADFSTAETCDADCKAKEICQMRASATQLTCYKSSLSGLTKRDEGVPVSIESGEALQLVDEYLHRGPRTQHGTLQCGGHIIEIFSKMARDKASIRKVVETHIRGRAAV
ncbi:hypothetical protein TWF694_003305 [Orbilia ellipsospora]|uniref:Sphingomyelin phosphodiesterase n=1 Tax=Orbilia ellipsospora TaxID=2528407 RepID=A0AAV9X2G9_9PEZI